MISSNRIVLCAFLLFTLLLEIPSIESSFRDSSLRISRSARLSSSSFCPGDSLSCPLRNISTGGVDCYTACDNTVDCTGATDELDCSCAQKIDPAFCCEENQYPDCPDKEDEKGCLSFDLQCDAEQTVCIPANDDIIDPSICIDPAQMCDGTVDCNDGSDEICYRLVANPADTGGLPGWRPEGYLQHRLRGVWSTVCYPVLEIGPVVERWCTHAVGEDRDYGNDNHNRTRITFSASFHCSSNDSYYVRCAPPSCFTKLPERIESNSMDRIIGGNIAPVGSWSAIVSLRKDGEHDCGGTVISSSFVMVAAHCMRSYKRHQYEVHAGVYRRSTFSPTVQHSLVEEIFLHPDFNFSSSLLFHDIALLRLQTPLLLNRWARPVCLPPRERLWIADHDCAIAGWGFTKPTNDGHTVDELRQVYVPLTSLQQCQDAYGRERVPDNKEVLCAGILEGGKDACSGDSGGPLMCRACFKEGIVIDCSNKNVWTQEGIVSYGRGCAKAATPGVYTRVSRYLPWIEEVLDYEQSHYNKRRYIVKRKGAQKSCDLPWGASLPDRKICDGKVDCLRAEDEDGYPNCVKSQIPTAISASTLPTTASQVLKLGTSAPDNVSSCPKDFFKCSSSVGELECISQSKRCDGRPDCSDATDELKCSCLLRLVGAGQNDLLCDGVPDCLDHGDEGNGCPAQCTSENHSFECPSSHQCLPKENVCDQNYDCTFGEDEVGCVTLSTDSNEVLLDDDGTAHRMNEGFLVMRNDDHGVYSPVCDDNNPPEKLDRLCHFLGYENHVGIEYIEAHSSTVYIIRYIARSVTDPEDHLGQIHKVNEEEYINKRNAWTLEESLVQNKIVNKREESHYVTTPPADDYGMSINESFTPSQFIKGRQSETDPKDICSQAHITCGGIRCGIIPKILKDPNSYTGFGSTPWAVGIYVDGLYICGGTLVHSQWVLTSEDCIDVQRRSGATMYVVGGSRRGPFGSLRIMGPFERESAVHHNRHVPGDMMLLHLARPLPATTYINALCLPQRESSWPGSWKKCSMVGNDGYILTHHLQLVPSAECSSGEICFQPYAPFNYTAEQCSSKWSGLIACINSTSDETQWVAVGLWQHSLKGCEFPTRHKLLTNATLVSLTDGMAPPSRTSSVVCDSHQCPLGKCVPRSAVCDGSLDCADLSDEHPSCPPPAFRCQNFTDSINCSCPEREKACWDGTCLSSTSFCDGRVDCANSEDEQDCPCVLLLRLQRPDSVCDGRIDCADETDEKNCTCDVNTQFRCFRSPNSSACIPLAAVCDNRPHCPREEDEASCSTLLPLPETLGKDQSIDTSLLTITQDVFGMPVQKYSGLLTIRYKGRWFTYNYNAWDNDFSRRICNRMNFAEAETSSRRLMQPTVVSNPSARSVHVMSRSKSDNSSETVAVYIACKNSTKM